MDKLFVVTGTVTESMVCQIRRNDEMIPLYTKDFIKQEDGSLMHPMPIQSGDTLYSAYIDASGCTITVAGSDE